MSVRRGLMKRRFSLCSRSADGSVSGTRSRSPESQTRKPALAMNLSVPARAPVGRVRSTGYGNRIGLAVMLAGIFVTVMDNSIVNVAIPAIRTTLGATFAEAELVVAGYTFTFATGLITGGRLGDVLGQRRMFLAGFAAFTVTSALCGLAPSPRTLIVA